MDKNHPFAKGFASTWPEGGRFIRNITTIGDRHYVTGIGSCIGNASVAIGVAGRTAQEDEGRLAASMLKEICSSPENTLLEEFTNRVKSIAKQSSVDVHQTRVCALMPTKHGFAPTLEIEVSEIDDVLMSKITSHRVNHESMPAARGDIGAGSPEKFMTWCSAQAKLRRMRSKTGLLIDPVLKSMLSEADLERLVAHLRKDPINRGHFVKSQWRNDDLRGNSIDIPSTIESVHPRDGIINAKIHLSPDVVWETKHRSLGWAAIELKKTLPASVIQGLAGKRLCEVIDHPLFERTWKIRKIKTSPLIALRGLEIHIACEPVPASSASLEGVVERTQELKGKDV